MNCEREKEERLRRVFGSKEGEGGQQDDGMLSKVTFEEWKWKVKYAASRRAGGNGELEMDLGKEVAAVGNDEARRSDGDDKAERRASSLRKIARWRWKRGSWTKSVTDRSSASMKSPVHSKLARSS